MISLVRGQAERLRPPRVLHCDFPLGRPLGVPGDATFQHRVLRAAFALLDADSPTIVDFPDVVGTASDDEPLSCALPVRHDPSVHAAVEEALGLRPAYSRRLERTGRTNVGRAVAAEDVPAVVGAFAAVAAGTPLEIAEMPVDVSGVALDVRAYYEEAAEELSGHVPAARAAERWLFRETEAGQVLIDAKRVLRTGGEPRATWFHLVPRTEDPDYDWDAPPYQEE